MSTTTLHRRLVTLEVRQKGGEPPPFIDIGFDDGGPGDLTESPAPKTLEEYRQRYGCEPPVIIRIAFGDEAEGRAAGAGGT